MADQQRCARCGAPLQPHHGDGESCPRCLLALGLSTGLGSRDPTPAASPAGGGLAGFPDHLGELRILDCLGVGEAGTVYLAEQAPPAQGKVALKVVRTGLDAAEVLDRFEAEHEALTHITHPGIAKVLQTGTTEDGRAYFVMEWIRGVPITEYCDRERLTTHRRLALFVEVCEALHRAHEVGVVHRNIKPSNVLVVEEDGKPHPKVLDLGIARALDQRLTAESLYSARSLLSGTPCYVPPELMDPSGLPPEADARSDVYSLGVLLFELLVGTPPFDARRLRQAGWAEMVRVIREEEPAPPGRRVRGLGGVAATEVALQRGTEPRRLALELQGDLDAIVLATLLKDPSRRYSSVLDLATDVRRHLRHEPVSVRTLGLGARLRRFLRRS